jgi:hypothetical protein
MIKKIGDKLICLMFNKLRYSNKAIQLKIRKTFNKIKGLLIIEKTTTATNSSPVSVLINNTFILFELIYAFL